MEGEHTEVKLRAEELQRQHIAARATVVELQRHLQEATQQVQEYATGIVEGQGKAAALQQQIDAPRQDAVAENYSQSLR